MFNTSTEIIPLINLMNLNDNRSLINTNEVFEQEINKIFVDDLLKNWNECFFAGLRYVFTEQPNVDWAFKTSFIKAKHNVGELDQRITFKNDSLPSYESYINEVKPYRTKVREYLSSYEKTDPSSTVVTDFDLPTLYNDAEGRITPQSVQVIDNKIVDTLTLAREKFPGSQVSLDALCKRFNVDNSRRVTHTALIDCDLLAKVYINLIDQKEPTLDFQNNQQNDLSINSKADYFKKIIKPSAEELRRLKYYLQKNLQNQPFFQI